MGERPRGVHFKPGKDGAGMKPVWQIRFEKILAANHAAQQAAENREILEEIKRFSKRPYFEEYRIRMIILLQHGGAETLQQAYDKAKAYGKPRISKVRAKKRAKK